jgi:hypothetical protein
MLQILVFIILSYSINTSISLWSILWINIIFINQTINVDILILNIFLYLSIFIIQNIIIGC